MSGTTISNSKYRRQKCIENVEIDFIFIQQFKDFLALMVNYYEKQYEKRIFT